MEAYLPPDESELLKYIYLNQKILFQVMKGVKAFLFEQPLPLQLPFCRLAVTLFPKHFPFSGPLLLQGFCEGVFSASSTAFEAMCLSTTDLVETSEIDGKSFFSLALLVV